MNKAGLGLNLEKVAAQGAEALVFVNVLSVVLSCSWANPALICFESVQECGQACFLWRFLVLGRRNFCLMKPVWGLVVRF